MLLNISINRKTPKWTPREQVKRVLWDFVRPTFRYSPRVFWQWRIFILRLFGARIESGVHIYPTAAIAIPWNLIVGTDASIGDRAIIYNLGIVSIGNAATISQGSHLCAGTHDYRRAEFPLLKVPISIGEGAWICADSFIGPGVNVGEYAVVGARAVVVRDVSGWSIVAGNPARVIGRRAKPVSE